MLFCLLYIVLTQEEWNEKQRAVRKPEFSWAYDGTSKTHENRFSAHQNDEEDDDDDDTVGPSLDMFFQPSNNPNKQTTITSKSFKQIHNELDNEPTYYPIDKSVFGHNAEDDADNLDNIPLPSESRTGTEIAPPPTYEYYGPSSRGQRVKENLVSVDEMQNSISKGFNNANNRNKSRQIRSFMDDDDDDDNDNDNL